MGMLNPNKNYSIFLFSILAVVVVPLAIPSSYHYLFVLTCLYAFLASSWNIIGGMGGQLSIGHAIYFGIGGYTTALLYQTYDVSPWLGMWLGGSLSALVAAFIGILCFRFNVKGVYFALVTLSIAEVARIIVVNSQILGGSGGILISLKGQSWSAFQFENRLYYYYIILSMTLTLISMMHLFRSSKFMSYLVAIREDEESAEAMGINTFKIKIIGIMLSGLLTSLGGSFFVQYTLFLDPPSMFGLMRSFDPIVICIMGGIGSVIGPILGSVIFVSIMELINHIFKGALGSTHLIFYGLLLMIIILIFPKGVASLIGETKSERVKDAAGSEQIN